MDIEDRCAIEEATKLRVEAKEEVAEVKRAKGEVAEVKEARKLDMTFSLVLESYARSFWLAQVIV